MTTKLARIYTEKLEKAVIAQTCFDTVNYVYKHVWERCDDRSNRSRERD